MSDVEQSAERPNGRRERKRKDTLKRISDVAVRLFGERGYEATTLDTIAAEAGISRRTFFHYFKSKDDILLSMQTGIGDLLAAALADVAPGQRPLPALQEVMLRISALYPPGELMVIDRLMLASEAVQSRKQASYVRDEGILLRAMQAHWPEEAETSLRLIAMLCVGISRIALDAWRSEGGHRPLTHHVQEHFAAMRDLSQQM